jgi:hypothetical protein
MFSPLPTDVIVLVLLLLKRNTLSIFGFLATDHSNEGLVHVKVSFPFHASNSIDGVGSGVHFYRFPVTLNARKYPSALSELGVRGPPQRVWPM